MWIIIAVILFLSLLWVLGVPQSQKGGRSSGHLGFYAKGMDAGFSLGEINLLWRAAQRAHLEKPKNIYGSVEELDKAINQIAGNRKLAELSSSDKDSIILKKLFAYRKKVEMSRPAYRSGLKSTQEIAIGQKLTLRAEGAGVYSSTVVENEMAYMTITIPVGPPIPPGFSWRQNTLKIYFWKENDAGYFFQTRLIETFRDMQNLHFRLYHTDEILRSQQRSSVRAPSQFPANLCLLKNFDESSQGMDTGQGLNGIVTDVSEDGLALKISGKGKKNQPVRIQFTVRDEMVVVLGVVKHVTRYEDDDESVLHVEFLSPSDNTRMIILAYVYDIDRRRHNSEQMEKVNTPIPVNEDLPANDIERA